jgi:GTP:adenosylcobinamide-phosphate guanylyltransferase
MIAVIMAGGQATRFARPTEKAVLEIAGRTLLERATDALEVPKIEGVVAAVSPHTVRSEEFARELGIEIFRTRGEGYHEDTVQLMDALGPFVSLNVDAPFVTRDHVKAMLGRQEGGSLTAVVPEGLAIRRPDSDSVMTDASGRRLVWAGLNIVRPVPDIELVEYDDPLLTININNEDDLEFARKVAEEDGR